jgi:hypothetical protein
MRLVAAVRTGYNRASSIRRGLRRGDGRHVRGPRPNLIFAVVFLLSVAGQGAAAKKGGAGQIPRRRQGLIARVAELGRRSRLRIGALPLSLHSFHVKSQQF